MTDVEKRISDLWYRQHMDTLDIAKITGIPEARVYSILWRVREMHRLVGSVE